MNIKIGENIANLRKKKGITQEDLANQFKVSNQAVSKWEAGKCYPDIELLPELSCYFEVSIDELLMGEGWSAIKSCTVNDDILLQAIRIAQENQYISTSALQRKLNIGYSRAKKLIDDMCRHGYIVKDPTSRTNSYIYNSATK